MRPPIPRGIQGPVTKSKAEKVKFVDDGTVAVSVENKMAINSTKTKVISFTKSRNWDFPPEIQLYNGTQLECINKLKLIGVVVSNDLKWHKNTAYIYVKKLVKSYGF